MTRPLSSRTLRFAATVLGLLPEIGGAGSSIATAANMPRVAVQFVRAADVVDAELESLTASELRLKSADAEPQVMRLHDVRSLTLQSSVADQQTATSAADRAYRVLLSNGDEIVAAAVGIADEALTVQRRARSMDAEPAVPLEFVRAIRPITGDTEVDLGVLRQVLRGKFRSDTLLLRSGDRWEGDILSWDESGCRLRTASGEQIFAADTLAAVVLDPALLADSPASPARNIVCLADGSMLSAVSIVTTEAQWRMKLIAGAELRVPIDAVRRIDFVGPAVQPLSAITPTEFDQQPFLTRSPRFERDRNVDCGPLQIGNASGDWGLGVWSGVRLAWTLPSGFSRFETVVGVDAAAGRGGSVDFVVLVDGVERARSGPRTGSDSPLALGPIAISGALRLELVTEFATGGDVLDYADWCRPSLLR